MTKRWSAGTPDGTVQFLIDGNNFGDPVPLSDDTANVSIADLPLGTHTVTATYTVPWWPTNWQASSIGGLRFAYSTTLDGVFRRVTAVVAVTPEAKLVQQPALGPMDDGVSLLYWDNAPEGAKVFVRAPRQPDCTLRCTTFPKDDCGRKITSDCQNVRRTDCRRYAILCPAFSTRRHRQQMRQ